MIGSYSSFKDQTIMANSQTRRTASQSILFIVVITCNTIVVIGVCLLDILIIYAAL